VLVALFSDAEAVVEAVVVAVVEADLNL